MDVDKFGLEIRPEVPTNEGNIMEASFKAVVVQKRPKSRVVRIKNISGTSLSLLIDVKQLSEDYEKEHGRKFTNGCPDGTLIKLETLVCVALPAGEEVLTQLKPDTKHTMYVLSIKDDELQKKTWQKYFAVEPFDPKVVYKISGPNAPWLRREMEESGGSTFIEIVHLCVSPMKTE